MQILSDELIELIISYYKHFNFNCKLGKYDKHAKFQIITNKSFFSSQYMWIEDYYIFFCNILQNKDVRNYFAGNDEYYDPDSGMEIEHYWSYDSKSKQITIESYPNDCDKCENGACEEHSISFFINDYDRQSITAELQKNPYYFSSFKKYIYNFL